MKRVTVFLLIVTMFLGAYNPVSSFASTNSTDLGKWGTAEMTLEDDGTLVISNGETSSARLSNLLPDPKAVKSIKFEGKVTLNAQSSYAFTNSTDLVSFSSENLDTSKVTNMSYMFYGTSSLTSLDLSGFDTSNVTTMRSMFEKASKLTNLDLSNFNTSKVTDMRSMFNLTSSLTNVNVSSFDTSNVTTMSEMFKSTFSLANLDLSNFNTSNVTDMSAMFTNTNLTNIDLTNFDTSKVTNMALMFYGIPSLTSIDLSSFDTSNVTNMSYMFYYTSGLTNLDLSNFDTSKVTNMRDMFYSMSHLLTLDIHNFTINSGQNTTDMLGELSNLKEIKLGSKINSLENTALPEHEATDEYTSNWQNVGTGSEQAPNGSNIWSASELINNYNGDTDADTYVWQKPTKLAEDVTVKYVDESGKELHTAQTISGNIGDSYDATTSAYKLAIDGYTLDTSKLPENGTGTLSDTAQTVTYAYTKDPIKAEDVTVKYVDESGKELHTAQIISGNIGDSYDATTSAYKLAIDGYTLDTNKLPENGTGTLSDIAQTVTYTYTKDPVKAEDVTVKYVDESGKELHAEQTISGNIGDSYDATTSAYKLAIDGYTLDTSKLPENGTGTLSDTAQTVTYTYTQDPIKAEDVTVKYVDESGKELHAAQTISGNIGDSYDATTSAYKLAIDGYKLDTSKLPENGTGTLSDTAQTVTYTYTKDPVKAEDVTIKYVDEAGKELHAAQTISGNIGDSYDATTSAYKLAISGYTLDETKLPNNSTGKFTISAQTVTYVYQKTKIKQAIVIAKYVDKDGKEIASTHSLTGKIGEKYQTKAKTIKGWKLIQIPKNAIGVFTEKEQTVLYVYEKIDGGNKPNIVTPTNPSTPATPASSKHQPTLRSKEKTIPHLPSTGDSEKEALLYSLAGILLIGSVLWLKRKSMRISRK